MKTKSFRFQRTVFISFFACGFAKLSSWLRLFRCLYLRPSYSTICCSRDYCTRVGNGKTLAGGNAEMRADDTMVDTTIQYGFPRVQKLVRELAQLAKLLVLIAHKKSISRGRKRRGIGNRTSSQFNVRWHPECQDIAVRMGKVEEGRCRCIDLTVGSKEMEQMKSSKSSSFLVLYVLFFFYSFQFFLLFLIGFSVLATLFPRAYFVTSLLYHIFT